MNITSYKDLIVWQKAMELVTEIYRLTSLFPKSELFGIISQIRRAVISIPSNIAEGYGRKSMKQYEQFYLISYGSALEIETQLIASKNLNFAPEQEFEKSELLLQEVIKMLFVMIYGRRNSTVKS